jgi:adenylate cyclase
VGLLVLSQVLGVNLVFVLRGIALKAAEEEVLERFVPQGLTQRLAHAGGTVPARIVPVTILIADIRGFTTISEPLGPTEAVGLLNGFFATMVGPLAAEEAVLDKYLGDGLLAFVEGEQHAARGLRAARNIVRAVDETNVERVAAGEAPIRMGVGVHTASAFVGSIGAPSRMEYTIIGDAVNVTSRLEGLMSSKAGADRIPATIVASGDTVRAAAEDGFTMPELEGPRAVLVHGRAQSLDVYYLPAE